MKEKITIYQVLPRLYGNKIKRNIPNGTIDDNGCGKMSVFTDKELARIRSFGFTHIWYTGLLEHATQTDYTAYGIRPDHPQVVKGRAGSPYAIKDYYDIDPDLATHPKHRMAEFEALVTRTHKAGLKMVIDFVPNHVARQYHSDAHPTGVRDLGADDDTTQAFAPQNNFYYQPHQALQLHFAPCPSGAVPYTECPAKATGNDHFDAAPGSCDWYETVKLNYGIDYTNGEHHFSPIPNTWVKMTDILLFWAAKGIDAFRCDMAEMVPCDFWHYAIARVKTAYPHIRFIAEVYNPNEYRNYIHHGGFDYLYDKVGLYDTLRDIICQRRPAAALTGCWQQVDDIRTHMLAFLENHDEQRIASDFFVGDARRALPALVAATFMGTQPFMVYAGQELGERGMDAEGFSGRNGRTTIFDYWSVPTLDALAGSHTTFTPLQQELYNYYRTIIRLCNEVTAVREGDFFDLMYVNYDRACNFNPDHHYAFLRHKDKETLLVVCNFDDHATEIGVRIPAHAFNILNLGRGKYVAFDLLTRTSQALELCPDAHTFVKVPALGATILKIDF